MSLKCFNQTSTSFIQITSDNRLTVWDAASGVLEHQYYEDDHLTAQYSCLAYVEVAADEPTSKPGKKRKVSKSETVSVTAAKFAALGNSRGKIVVWDLNKSEVVHRLQFDTNYVNDLAFSKDGTKLYSCSTSKYVLEWDLATEKVSRKLLGGKHGVKRICLSDDGTKMLTASSGIRLWDIESLTRLKKYAGHHSQVTSLKFVANDEYFVSGGGDRFLNLWSMEDGREKSPVALLSVQYAPSSVSWTPISDSVIRIAVNTDADAAYIWQVDTSGLAKGKKNKKNKALAPEKPTTVLSLANEYNRTAKILDVHLDQANKPSVVHAVYGTSTKPCFEMITYVDDEDEEDEDAGECKAKVTINANTAQLLDTAGTLTGNARSASEMQRTATLGIVNSKLANPVSDLVEGSTDNRPLAERVREMTTELMEDHEADDGEEDDEQPDSEVVNNVSNNAASISSVLEQALQSGDNRLLEVCLQHRNVKVIRNTVQKLRTSRVVQFLQVLVRKFETRPSRGPMLLVWIRAILEVHAAYLLTIPKLSLSLNGLYQTIEARVATYKKMSKLSGRLEFIMSQISSQSPVNSTVGKFSASEPLTVFDENKSTKRRRDSVIEGEDELDDSDMMGSDDESDQSEMSE